MRTPSARLRDIDRRLPRETLLATGTSTIPVGRLAQGLAHPERVCGVHFFLPVAERPVVEVIAGPATPAAACKKAVGLAAALGKEAISAPDVVGFLVNRLMLPYVSEAMQLLAEGVAEETIERAALDFGMPQGPLSLLDEIGLDTALDCGWVFAGAYEDRIAISPLLVALVKARRLGLKTRAGFFRYTRRDDGSFAQEIDPAVAAARSGAGRRRARSASADAVAARLFLPMLFEGVRLLEEARRLPAGRYRPWRRPRPGHEPAPRGAPVLGRPGRHPGIAPPGRPAGGNWQADAAARSPPADGPRQALVLQVRPSTPSGASMSTMLRVPQKPPSAEKTGSPAMPWHPRMWHGMTMGAWLKTLARHRPAISPSRWVLAGTISMSTPVNSALAALQQMLHGRRIRSLAIDKAPIFILGHWRSGTTLLHELLVLDERHTYPNTYACYTPRHFLVSRYLVPWWLKFLMPARRPMDNMKVGWNRPQEDEFAMCNMGVPSPYLAFAFPNIPNIGSAYFDLKKISPAELAEWKQAFVYFLKCVTLAGGGRRVVLKTPLHTCRVDLLREIFPDARFVHIVRDPYVIFPSTVRTWQRLSEDEGLQRPRTRA